MKQNEALDLQESHMDMYMANAILGPISDGQNQDRKMSVQEAAAYVQDASVVVPQATVVCHFFSELPQYEGMVPTTPKFSTVEFTVPDSDHGKEAAQQRWMKRMRMTPNTLKF